MVKLLYKLGYNPNKNIYKNIYIIFKKIINIIIGTYRNIFKIKTNTTRMNICKKCDHFEISTFGKKWDYCNECGCVLESKTRLENEKCPINKW